MRLEIGRKLDGGAEMDFVLEGNVFVDVKNYDRTSTFYQEPQNIQLVINRFLDQVRRYQIYTDEIKYVFKGSVPDVIREAIEQAGVIVEVIP